jgi:3-oxoadipate enol-lactonase
VGEFGIPRTTGSFEHDDEDIYYEVCGEEGSPWLVLGHGAGGNHAVWFQQVAWFCRSFRTLAWDQRGFGRSTNRRRAASPAAASADLAGLLDHLLVERAHVIGQSMGGWAAMGLTLDRPELVASLVLADTLGGIPVQEWIERRALPRRAEDVVGDHPALGPQFRRDHLDRALLYQQLGGWGLPNSERAGALNGLSTTTFGPERTAEISCPVLFIVGSDDEIFPPAWIHQVARAVPGATVEVIAGAGHSPYFETPERWNSVVTRHLLAAMG